MKNQGLTLTIIANMTSNYGEGLGNLSTVQKVFKNGKTFATRSRESLKNSLMVEAGFYDDLVVVSAGGVTQKDVNEELNASNCRALEGGYMNTEGTTTIRKSSIYLTDAISCSEFVGEYRFHNNLFMAQRAADQLGINLQEEGNAKEAGLMPYQYEYDRGLKVYSVTIDLDRVGVDENFTKDDLPLEADSEEKADRVISLLKAIQSLNLVVKGNLDNAEPVFIVGGIGERKTHFFENVINVENQELLITEDLKYRLGDNYKAALLEGGNLKNETEIKESLNSISISEFFDDLFVKVRQYYVELE